MSATLIPARLIGWSDLVSLRQTTVDQTMVVTRGAVGPQANLIFREAIANDVSAAAGSSFNARLAVPALVALTMTVAFTTALGNNKGIGFFGFHTFTPNPQVDVIKFSIGGARTLALIPVTEAYVYPELSGFFSVPVIFAPLDTIQISFLSHNGQAAATEFIQLLAYAIEPASVNVAPNDVGPGIGDNL